MNYTGYKIKQLSDLGLSKFYQGTLQVPDLIQNEYLIITDKDNKTIDYGQKVKDKIIQVSYPKLGTEFTGIMKPRNPQQYCAMDLLQNRDIPLKLITGKFGSGKTMACVIAALEFVEKGYFDKIIFVRNNVQVKDTDPLGALPGTEHQKLLPYLMPFADHCGGVEGLQIWIDQGQLEVIPLAFLRGRSIRNSIIYSMESENLTKEHIQLIMGRVDEGSELWLDGDIKQRDKNTFEKSRGLETMIERLAGNEHFGYVHLIKSERSEIAQLTDLLD